MFWDAPDNARFKMEFSLLMERSTELTRLWMINSRSLCREKKTPADHPVPFWVIFMTHVILFEGFCAFQYEKGVKINCNTHINPLAPNNRFRDQNKNQIVVSPDKYQLT